LAFHEHNIVKTGITDTETFAKDFNIENFDNVPKVVTQLAKQLKISQAAHVQNFHTSMELCRY